MSDPIAQPTAAHPPAYAPPPGAPPRRPWLTVALVAVVVGMLAGTAVVSLYALRSRSTPTTASATTAAPASPAPTTAAPTAAAAGLSADAARACALNKAMEDRHDDLDYTGEGAAIRQIQQLASTAGNSRVWAAANVLKDSFDELTSPPDVATLLTLSAASINLSTACVQQGWRG
jgi:hypothetical protein